MGRSVAEAQEAVDGAEFAEWLAYAQLEAFGEERMDLRFACLEALIANCNRGRGQPPARPKDFMLDFDGSGRPEQMTVEQMQARFRAAAPKPRKQKGKPRKMQMGQGT